MTIESKTVLFITGAFVSNTCWDDWKAYFESRGYTTLAPAWPNKEAPADVLRSRQPNPAIASNRLADLIKHYSDIARNLPEKPILIGHSIGGLLVQLLLQQDLGVAGAAIHSVPPQGVLAFEPSFVRSVWKALGIFSSKKEAHLMSLKEWQYAFTNGMSLADQQASYQKFVTPESKALLSDGLTKVAKVDYSKPHAPLLFVSGSTDNIMPASFQRIAVGRYKKGNSASVTEYKEFAGRNHFVLGLPTWKEEANFILDWLAAQ